MENFILLLHKPNVNQASINFVLQMYNIFSVKKWISYYLNLIRTYPNENTMDNDIDRPRITDMNIMPCIDPPWFHPAILYDEDKEFVKNEIIHLCNDEDLTDHEYNWFIRPVLSSLDFNLSKHSRVFSEGTYNVGDGYKVDLVPWINDDNEEEIHRFINQSKNPVCFGHFDLEGFEMMKRTKKEKAQDRANYYSEGAVHQTLDFFKRFFKYILVCFIN